MTLFWMTIVLHTKLNCTMILRLIMRIAGLHMLSFLLYSFAAFIFALIVIIVIFLVTKAVYRWPGWSFSFLMLLDVSASMVRFALSERTLPLIHGAQSDGDTGETLLLKLPSIVVAAGAFALCIAQGAFLHNVKGIGRYNNRALEPPTDIFIAFSAFYVALNIIPIFFGQQYYFHTNLIYPLFIYFAFFLGSQMSSIDPVIVIKQGLGSIVLCSLIAAAISPQISIEPNHPGLVPGFVTRLWGVTGHANSLGAVASALLIFEAAEPSARVWLRTCVLAAAGLAMFWSQSKTSILAALVGLSIIYGWHILAGTCVKSSDGSKGYSIATGLVVVFSAAIPLAVVWMMVYDWGVISSFTRSLNTEAVEGLSTASGRTVIWAAAIKGGLENPLFGQGAGFWQRLNLWGAIHAHNLFLQVFSTAGIFGLAALMVFLYFLVRYSIRASTITQGGSLAFMAMFFLRAMTEANMQTHAIQSGEFFAMMAYLLYVMDRGAKPIKAS